MGLGNADMAIVETGKAIAAVCHIIEYCDHALDAGTLGIVPVPSHTAGHPVHHVTLHVSKRAGRSFGTAIPAGAVYTTCDCAAGTSRPPMVCYAAVAVQRMLAGTHHVYPFGCNMGTYPGIIRY